MTSVEHPAVANRGNHPAYVDPIKVRVRRFYLYDKHRDVGELSPRRSCQIISYNNACINAADRTASCPLYSMIHPGVPVYFLWGFVDKLTSEAPSDSHCFRQ
eukprot:Protomagalhaensia_wolfi_Nauph_80__3728@NODE_3769_length_715_cov_3_214497_g2973_i0_p1_GENE_NODE_3769_length_715_cov_3_214497_g2973_i0NODE_3769_length_715_cov_3_214497_g2973_i0_p1_ORF_typecomplete_len102_score0_98_NODE_3769_length_715_cov_3_214497_g2973_i0395700